MCEQILEQDRLKLLSVERLLLETICFNFKVNMPFSYVVKFAKALGGKSFSHGPVAPHCPPRLSSLTVVLGLKSPPPASKSVAQAAWRISVDSYVPHCL